MNYICFECGHKWIEFNNNLACPECGLEYTVCEPELAFDEIRTILTGCKWTPKLLEGVVT